MRKILSTDRLLMRSWEEHDGSDLFRFCAEPEIGYWCGFVPHQTEADSLAVIRMFQSLPEVYAICLKSDERAIGCIELRLKNRNDFSDREDECELGFWLGAPFWGQGIIPEAGNEILRYAFEDLSMRRVWCAYYAGNDKSRRVQEKLGFRFHHTTFGVDLPLLQEKRIGYVSALDRDEWFGRARI